VLSNRPSRRRRRALGRPLIAVLASGLVLLAGLPTAFAFHDDPGGGASIADVTDLVGHLVISEVLTGGVSASDEFIELYNPQPEPMPLEGLEVVYVTASGGTITRKAAWSAGSAPMAGGGHVLIANSAGVFASMADQTYTSGLAATGGSVALRIQGATAAIDAVGWGNATSTWIEGAPGLAVAAGHSIERLPGGSEGSGQDTEDNSVDFVDRAAPDPQNSLSTPIPIPAPSASATPLPTGTTVPTATALPTDSPSVMPTPSQTASATVTPPTPAPTATATPTPTLTPLPSQAEPMTITQVRALADGTTVLVEGIALTDSAFADGGGYLADDAAGIAVLLTDGSFARGVFLRVSGVLDDRFSQRTIRADAAGIAVLGDGTDPTAQPRATGQIGENEEGELVEVNGMLTSGATQLTSGVAFDVDDGTGPIRLLVGSATGIDTVALTRGSQIHVRGVVGQRDSSGTGAAGYRLQPRDAADMLSVAAPTPTPTPSATASTTPSATPSANPDVISIAAARSQPFNARVSVRGVVTLPSGLVEEGTAAIQDSSGAIVLRLGDEAGRLQLGELVEVAGTRSTKAGMETIRVVATPRHLGTQSGPDPRRRDTGALGEREEATLVVVRGTVTTTPRRTSADNVYFDVDDGSGPIRIFAAPGAEVETESLLSGTVVEVTGVLGQETTGRLPDRGYRFWPRRSGDLEVVAQPDGATFPGGTGGAGSGPPSSGTEAPSGPHGSTAGNGSQQDGAPQQERPRLEPAAGAQQSAAPIPVVSAATPEAAGDRPTQPLAAGLLAIGGLLLVGSGVATGDPRLSGRLLARLRSWIGRGAAQDADASNDASLGADETIETALPRLVPLAVAEDAGGASARAARDVLEERGRILPPI
jgi:hypothetical protein